MKEFKFLGAVITDDNLVKKDESAKIMAGNNFTRLLRCKFLKRQSKLTLYKSIIRQIVNYGSENWTLIQREINTY